ncbi:variant erythrocyte surface antigen-1 alpha subunit [Babesia bovis T2Bo]|uniref:Variant erythrocyte surface antigen-1, alpha subunit n=1 Tax=Babesia bovis TaxID=5865 RepID=A7ATW3_BABBO|nr:variant erythrocyte surface antigen-1 alpha subunit [Babesia bovis T2Bo]EDO06374.1 variant erythrocyte surface antigen-1 alpha subunit [Babesia bovis T2Bo]|eukprot:XP_001609942.1 variant erythrocyte surface antigen-1, alpha subunit [Babesia bovis T2Bo]
MLRMTAKLFDHGVSAEGGNSITKKNAKTTKHSHESLESLNKVLDDKKEAEQKNQDHPLSNLLSQVGKLQYDIRLPWIFVLTLAWLVAVLYLAFGAIWPLDWTYIKSHCRGWFRKGSLSPWEVLMVGKSKALVKLFSKEGMGWSSGCNWIRWVATVVLGGSIIGTIVAVALRGNDGNPCGLPVAIFVVMGAGALLVGVMVAVEALLDSVCQHGSKLFIEFSCIAVRPYKAVIHSFQEDRLKEVTKKPEDNIKETPTLAFLQTCRNAPIRVDVFNLFAHFQAVTQYCPLVLIGIQGGLKGTDKTLGPAIHSLYSNSHFSFTYTTVPIQAYNQVQCAVKVALGGKWRECRYGKDVVSKGVISWMCLGCDPMEHDRKSRVNKVKEGLVGVTKKVEKDAEEGSEAGEAEEENGNSKTLGEALKDVLEKIGDVVVQLAIQGVKTALVAARTGLEKAKGDDGDDVGTRLYGTLEENVEDGVDNELKKKLDELTNGSGGSGILKDLDGKVDKANSGEYDPGKNEVSKAVHKVLEVLKALENGLETAVRKDIKDELNGHQGALSPKCHNCGKHSTKCGRQGEKRTCDKCHQPYMDGTPSPLQAFLEDRLPGFSCQKVVDQDTDHPDYPPAASHLEHCGGSGQCCPLPMGFRNQFQKGGISDCTGKRLYGILYFFSNENMMQSCVYTLVRVTAELSATTPQVLGDVFGFFRGGVGNGVNGQGEQKDKKCDHGQDNYFCGWCASGLRDVVKKIEWIPKCYWLHAGSLRLCIDNTSVTIGSATEVIKALIDQLALGLQKWVGWHEGDTCCLGQKSKGKSDGGVSKGIGEDCGSCGKTVNPGPCWCPDCSMSTSGICSGTCQGCANKNPCCHCASQPDKCKVGTCKCYISAYRKNGQSPSEGPYYWPTISDKPDQVHLLARIFLGSVCLIWSGLSQLGFLTGDKRWKDSKLHEIGNDTSGLGSFMAAMGYDLDRLNGSGGKYCLG